MSSHTQHRPAPAPQQVPLLLALERAEKARPADTLRARLVGALHEHLSGLTGIVSRSAKCWQMGLRGLRPVTLRDIAEVAASPTREARAATHAIAMLLLDAARPSDATLPGAAIADLLREVGETVGAYSKAMDDGTLDVAECDHILGEVDDLQRVAACLRAAVEGHRRRLAA